MSERIVCPIKAKLGDKLDCSLCTQLTTPKCPADIDTRNQALAKKRQSRSPTQLGHWNPGSNHTTSYTFGEKDVIRGTSDEPPRAR